MNTSTWGYTLRLVQPRLRKVQARLYADRVNHYDSLGITSKATQADIKSAYYKLSMVYHPDKNQNDSGAARKFRSITAAYEVLGNVKSRRLYDRGFFFENVGTTATTEMDEPVNKFYKSREVRSRPPAPHGRTMVYDFDEWTKAHYGKTFKRDMENKRRAQNTMYRRNQIETESKVENAVLFIGFLVLTVCLYLRPSQYDEPGELTNIGGTWVRTRKTD